MNKNKINVFTVLLSRIFNKSNFNNILMLFMVGFVSRVLVGCFLMLMFIYITLIPLITLLFILIHLYFFNSFNYFNLFIYITLIPIITLFILL